MQSKVMTTGPPPDNDRRNGGVQKQAPMNPGEDEGWEANGLGGGRVIVEPHNVFPW